VIERIGPEAYTDLLPEEAREMVTIPQTTPQGNFPSPKSRPLAKIGRRRKLQRQKELLHREDAMRVAPIIQIKPP